MLALNGGPRLTFEGYGTLIETMRWRDDDVTVMWF
jgi:hypothetical protein